MAFFRFLFNLIWFVLGGVFMGLAWWLAGLLCFISLIGIPWGRACFVIGTFAFWPFGKQAVNRQTVTRYSDIGTGALGLVGNIIWFVLIGFWLAVGHLLSALACFVTLIGIPFGIQHLKLALISIAPIGQMIVTNQEAESGRYIR
ncbi:MAG: YccF domain-containing protein [Aeromonas sp.]